MLVPSSEFDNALVYIAYFALFILILSFFVPGFLKVGVIIMMMILIGVLALLAYVAVDTTMKMGKALPKLEFNMVVFDASRRGDLDARDTIALLHAYRLYEAGFPDRLINLVNRLADEGKLTEDERRRILKGIRPQRRRFPWEVPI